MTSTGNSFESSHGLVSIHWAFVRDRDGTHRDEYFFSTDAALDVAAIIAHYTGRWNLSTTFRELCCHLGPETTRRGCRNTVLRAAPCQFGLNSEVAVLYLALSQAKRGGVVAWPGKAAVTFSDGLSSVRRWLWSECVIPQAGCGEALEKVPWPVRVLLLAALAPAA